METYEIDTIKIEKLKAMRRYNTFKKIATIVKTLEILIAIMFISFSMSWSSSYIPIAVNFSTTFLRRISSLLFSPHFVFVIGNAIVITLFAKSSSSDNSAISSPEDFSGESPVPVEEERETDKATVRLEEETETDKATVPLEEARETEKAIVPMVEQSENKREKEQEKSYRRTKSTVEVVAVKDEEKKELRRSVTEPRRKAKKIESSMRMFEEDDLSGEEFRRKVEAFIEKQQRFLREEIKAVVLSK